MKIEFYLRFQSKYRQSVFVSGNLASLGNSELQSAFPLRYLNDEFWYGTLDVEPSDKETLHYHYIFQNENGELIKEGEKNRAFDLYKNTSDLVFIDSWNDESFYENAFYTAPFTEVFFKERKKVKFKSGENPTHLFKVKAPLLQPNEAVCLLGNTAALGAWNIAAPLPLSKKGDWWVLETNLTNATLPASYKYGVVNIETNEFVRFEDGDNRALFNDDIANKKTIVHDAFV